MARLTERKMRDFASEVVLVSDHPTGAVAELAVRHRRYRQRHLCLPSAGSGQYTFNPLANVRIVLRFGALIL
jgi:hypothetical protein